MSSKTFEKKVGKSKIVYAKVTTYLSDKSKKTLEKLQKAEKKPQYQIMNDALAFYISSKK